MPLIQLPPQIADVEWTVPTPAEYITRSGFSGKATIINRGGITAGWRARVTVAPRTEADTAIWKAFAAQARSKANVFRVPAVPNGLQSAAPVTAAPFGSGQSFNRALQNNALDNAAWSRDGIAGITRNANLSPIGTANDIWLVLENTSTGVHRITGSVFLPVDRQNNASIYAKFYNRQFFGISIAGAVATFDLVNGTVANVFGGVARIVPDDFGWYRCTLAGTAPGGTAAIYCLSDSGSLASITSGYTGAAGAGVLLWRPQSEVGLRASQSIVSNAAAVLSPHAVLLAGLAANATILPAGSLISFYDRLHVLTEDLVTGAAGTANACVSPPLARATTSEDTLFLRAPFGRMRMVSEDAGWADRLGYGEPASFDCEEAL